MSLEPTRAEIQHARRPPVPPRLGEVDRELNDWQAELIGRMRGLNTALLNLGQALTLAEARVKPLHLEVPAWLDVLKRCESRILFWREFERGRK